MTDANFLSNELFSCLRNKAMCRDSRIVPGAAATEIELARRLKEFSFKETGYFLRSFYSMLCNCSSSHSRFFLKQGLFD